MQITIYKGNSTDCSKKWGTFSRSEEVKGLHLSAQMPPPPACINPTCYLFNNFWFSTKNMKTNSKFEKIIH